jgi:hypothetical protein
MHLLLQERGLTRSPLILAIGAQIKGAPVGPGAYIIERMSWP